MAAYNHQAGTDPDLVEGTTPSSATEGFSHIWPGTHLGLTASDIAEVRFYCHTSNHDRVINFSTKNDWVKAMIVNSGQLSGNKLSYWKSGTTKLKGHTGFLPDTATSIRSYNQITSDSPFWDDQGREFAFNPSSRRWRCDDNVEYSSVDTSHQIWIKLAQ